MYELTKNLFRFVNYAVTSTSSSVIYFGGHHVDITGRTFRSDKVVEYKNLKWTSLGNLAYPRANHRLIKMQNKIYLFGGEGTT